MANIVDIIKQRRNNMLAPVDQVVNDMDAQDRVELPVAAPEYTEEQLNQIDPETGMSLRSKLQYEQTMGGPSRFPELKKVIK